MQESNTIDLLRSETERISEILKEHQNKSAILDKDHRTENLSKMFDSFLNDIKAPCPSDEEYYMNKTRYERFKMK